MKDDKVALLICVGMITNIMLIGLGIAQTDCYHYYGVCLLGGIINIAAWTMLMFIDQKANKNIKKYNNQ